MRKIISLITTAAILFSNVSASYAQAAFIGQNKILNIKTNFAPAAYQTVPQKIKIAVDNINGGIQVNNTAFKGKKPQESAYSLKAVIPAMLRYAQDTDEIHISAIHGLYPARYAYRAEDTAQNIMLLSALDTSNAYTERTLIPILSNPYVHEIVYIEALLALAKTASKNQLRYSGPALKAIIIRDLKFLRTYTSHELVYGAGKNFDVNLRSRINTALARLGVPADKPFINRATMAQFNQKKDYILDKINTGLWALTILSLGKFKASPAAKPAEPVRMSVIRGGLKTAEINPVSYERAAMRTSQVPSYSLRAAYEGNAALKLNAEPQIRPMRVIKTSPAPVAIKARVGAVAPKTFAAKQIPVLPLPYYGKKPRQIERFNKEQLKHKIRMGEEINEDNLSALSFRDRADIEKEARLYGVLKTKINSSKSSTVMTAQEMYSTVSLNAEQIKKYYGLNDTYINGYYDRRIYPYLSKPTFVPNSQNTVYRGMLLTIDELKDIIKNGIDINKTSWNVGAKGNAKIISSSSSSSEAKSYIFQSSDGGRLAKGAIGVVVEFTKTPSEKLFDDPKLNRTKTIYHTYSSIPANRIVGIYIYGEYGLESLQEVSDKIKSGKAADTRWHDSFGSSVSR